MRSNLIDIEARLIAAAPDLAAEVLRQAEEIERLREALARLCNEMEMPGERGVLHGVPAALANARAALASTEAKP